MPFNDEITAAMQAKIAIGVTDASVKYGQIEGQ